MDLAVLRYKKCNLYKTSFKFCNEWQMRFEIKLTYNHKYNCILTIIEQYFINAPLSLKVYVNCADCTLTANFSAYSIRLAAKYKTANILAVLMSNIQIKSKIKSKIVSQFIFCMTKGGAEAPPQSLFFMFRRTFRIPRPRSRGRKTRLHPHPCPRPRGSLSSA